MTPPDDTPRTRSGQPLEALTVGALRDGTIRPTDLAIHAETLRRQARIAEAQGYRQLAANFRRAAELTAIPDAVLVETYQKLRPHRSSYAELLGLAQEMAALHDAPETGAYIRDAAEAYREKGLLRSEEADR